MIERKKVSKKKYAVGEMSEAEESLEPSIDEDYNKYQHELNLLKGFLFS